MSHTTHFDDCGCLTARYEARIAELEQREREFDKLHAVQVARVEILIGEKATLEAELSGVRQASATELAHAYAHAKTLRDALAIIHDGHGGGAAFIAGEALAQTPAASLRSHDAEVWEKAWKCGHEAAFTKHDAEVLERAARAVVEGRSCKAQHPFQPGECEECHWFDGAANSARSALAAQEVKP